MMMKLVVMRTALPNSPYHCLQTFAGPNIWFDPQLPFVQKLQLQGKAGWLPPDAPGQDVGVSSSHLFPFLLAYPPALSQ